MLVTKVVVILEDVVVVAVLVEGPVVVVDDDVEVLVDFEELDEELEEELDDDFEELLEEEVVVVEVFDVASVEADVVVKGRFPGTPRARTVAPFEM